MLSTAALGLSTFQLWFELFVISEDFFFQIMQNAKEGSSNNSLAQISLEIRGSEKRIEERLKRLEEDVQSSQEEAVERAPKKARREKTFKFKKKGHQAQSEFNVSIADCIEEASAEVTRWPTD